MRSIAHAFNVDPDGERDVVLADGAEEGAEVDEPVDAVRHDDLLQVLEVQDVGEDERACKQRGKEADLKYTVASSSNM